MVKMHKNSVLNYREKEGVDKFSLGIYNWYVLQR